MFQQTDLTGIVPAHDEGRVDASRACGKIHLTRVRSILSVAASSREFAGSG
jgi:hypothetical protein